MSVLPPNPLHLLLSSSPGNDDPYEPGNDEYVDMALQRYISNDRLTDRMPAAGNGHNGSATNYYDDQKDPEMQRWVAFSRISLIHNK